jgi:hypothetical protein
LGGVDKDGNDLRLARAAAVPVAALAVVEVVDDDDDDDDVSRSSKSNEGTANEGGAVGDADGGWAAASFLPPFSLSLEDDEDEDNKDVEVGADEGADGGCAPDGACGGRPNF